VPGRPTLFGTTNGFLDYFNLKSLNELPTLAEIRDIDQFNPELVLFATENQAPGEPEASEAADGTVKLM
jgi:segregation and condensation protein B